MVSSHPALQCMAKEISNGTHTVKLYNYVDRGRKMHQIAYYEAGRRKLRNFSVKSEAETAALHVLHQLTDGTEAARAFRTPELESLVAARQVLASGYPLHVAVEEHAQAVGRLGKTTLREAVEFFLRHICFIAGASFSPRPPVSIPPSAAAWESSPASPISEPSP